MKKKNRIVTIAMAIVLTLIVSACGNGNNSSNSSNTSNTANNTTASSSNTAADSGSTEKKYEGQTLVVGVWGGPHEKVIDKYVRGPLEEMGANLELVLGGTGDRAALLYAEKGNPSMDVLFLNIYESKQAIMDGVAQDVDPEGVPNLADSYEIAQTYGYGSSIMALGIAYNPEKVAEPIDSWDDLWREDLKGKLSVSNFPGFEAESFLSVAGLAFGKTEADLEDNIEKVKELEIANSHYNIDELALEMTAGTIEAAVVFNYQANLLKEAGANVEFVYPSNPGPILAKNTMVISEGSKKTELAKEFINLMLTPEAQEELAIQGFYGPVNKTVELDEELASKVLYGPDAVDEMVSLDWTTIINQRSEATNLWNQKILAQ